MSVIESIGFRTNQLQHQTLSEIRGDAENALTVSRADGVFQIERYAADIDRLNAASRRPNAFCTAAFLMTYALRNEYHAPGDGERLFLVREGRTIIGCAPMRQAKQVLTPKTLSPLRLRGTRLEFLAPMDTEQLGFLCAPEDEERVAAALVAHFCREESGWGVLELVGQPPSGVLHRALHGMSGSRFWARDVAVQPYTEVPLSWPDLRTYFRSLTKHMRSNISRQARRLYAAGNVELVLARGAEQVGAWFEAYRDLDRRSWKGGTESSIERSARRVRFYREIAEGRAGIDPSFIGVILDDVLVAGLLVGSNETTSPACHGAWCLEMAYDRTRAELGPGQLLLLLAVGEALERKDRFLNFLQNFAYYKHRWGAESIEVVNVQLIRRLTPHDGRARVGELRHWWEARKKGTPIGEDPVASATEHDASKESSESPPTDTGAGVAVDLSRARQLTRDAIAGSGPQLRRLDRQRARLHIPFDLE